MDAEKIVQDLNRRFSTPLPEFYNRRIIFWYDEDREFEDQIDELKLDNAILLKATGSNYFEIKKLLTIDDTRNNYLVYCPISYDNPEDNWLLNIELFSGEPFRADLNTIWMDEMGLPSSQVLRKQVKQYHKFFNSKERRNKVAALAGNISSASQLHLAVMAVACGNKDLSPNNILRAVISGGLDLNSNAVYKSIINYGAQAPFWAMVAQATGYKNETEPDMRQLVAHILLTAATRTMHKDCFKGLEGFISMQCVS